MGLKTVGEEKVRERGAEGLKDGGHVKVTCSNCRAFLVDLWRTRPHEPHVWRVRANCPFCNDQSFVTEVAGGFHPGPAARSKADEPDEDECVSTVIEDSDIVDGIIYFKVGKNGPDAKPIKPR